MIRLVVVNVERYGKNFLFSVPGYCALKKGDRVRFMTKHGEIDGICKTDVIGLMGDAIPDGLIDLIGASEPMGQVVGRYRYESILPIAPAAEKL